MLVFSALSLSLKQSPALSRVQGLVISVTSPGLQALEYLVRNVKRLWWGYFDLVGARQENIQLHQTIEEYRQKEVRYREPSTP